MIPLFFFFLLRKGVICGTIPERDAPSLSAIPVEKLLGNQLLVDAIGEKIQRQTSNSGSNDAPDIDFDDRGRQSIIIAQTSGLTTRRKKAKQVWMAKRTFTVTCRNAAGAARCRVTFQIVPHPREQGSTGERKAPLE